MIALIQDLDKKRSIGSCAWAVDLARPSGRPRRNRPYGRPRSLIRASAARLGWRGAHFLGVQGFDFVPESLRSNTFTETAARVLSAHFSYNNFYNETEPMTTLANLGSTIPMPAFSKCIEATLAVWLGNFYGFSHGAEPVARQVLNALRPSQWEYYCNECLYSDRTLLDKLCREPQPIVRWKMLVTDIMPKGLVFRDKLVRELIEASQIGKNEQIMAKANQLRLRVTTERS